MQSRSPSPSMIPPSPRPCGGILTGVCTVMGGPGANLVEELHDSMAYSSEERELPNFDTAPSQAIRPQPVHTPVIHQSPPPLFNPPPLYHPGSRPLASLPAHTVSSQYRLDRWGSHGMGGSVAVRDLASQGSGGCKRHCSADRSPDMFLDNRGASRHRRYGPGYSDHSSSASRARDTSSSERESVHLKRKAATTVPAQQTATATLPVPNPLLQAGSDGILQSSVQQHTGVNVSTAGSRGGPGGYGMPSFPVAPGGDEFMSLIQASVTAATWKGYGNAWTEWVQMGHGRSLASDADRLQLTIDYLLQVRANGYSATVAQRRLSGLAFYFKLAGWHNVTKHFVISQALKGWKKEVVKRESRRPVSFALLRQLILGLQQAVSSPYEISLFQTAFSLAFFGALRISELVPMSKVKTGGLQAEDVILVNSFIRSESVNLKRTSMGRGLGSNIIVNPLEVLGLAVETTDKQCCKNNNNISRREVMGKRSECADSSTTHTQQSISPSIPALLL
ncbi:hypothetical protein XELAEV_18031458mg [Xenopus laevis]|uniref:Tyr recombinase domain-containing protein n=1 Tax=Xenopus laevis TaxID=8355 RepID=A0A974HFN2_XENLA|nr:hypothetical protein XELAEV_18031458mg [Xenopus laevis]